MARGEATPYTYYNLDGVTQTYLVAASVGAHLAYILPLPMQPSCIFAMNVTGCQTFCNMNYVIN
jgi:hypothetical protein